jgi:methionyl-tRNA synthetase
MVLADAMKRWEVLKGQRKAYLCTGTDEHGMKVQRAAERKDMHPKVFCDTTAETFKDLARLAEISNDYFIRTTDEDHREAVVWFWRQLEASGYIYEAKHEGWYCVSDETYYPENMVEKRIDPQTGKQFMASVESGSEVEWTEEKNYHFRLTAFKDKLLQFYNDNPEWLVPSERMSEIKSWVENNLEDLSISRPRNRLSWGIPVPSDTSQTIYVWVDALINYITKAGYPWAQGEEHQMGWPADVHVIGKDIVRFHCIYWPALLMAVGIPLPKRVISHGHWLMDQKKMSKSKGNVVNPFFAIDRWGADLMRYYLLLNGSYTNDSDYGNRHIVQCYKKMLQSGLGNTLSRVQTGKDWKPLDEVVQSVKNHGLGLERADKSDEYAQLKQYAERVDEIVDKVSQLYDELDPRAAQRALHEFVFDVSHSKFPSLSLCGSRAESDKTPRRTNSSTPWLLGSSRDRAERPSCCKTE